MWTNETIFSLGDMSHDEKLYEDFIEIQGILWYNKL